MTLLPFRMHLKYKSTPEASEIQIHDKALKKLCIPVGKMAFSHLVSPTIAQISNYAIFLASAIRHLEPTEELGARLSESISKLKAAEVSVIPSPIDVVIGLGYAKSIPGGPWLEKVNPHAIRGRDKVSVDSLEWTCNSLAGELGTNYEGYLEWLDRGMPVKDPPPYGQPEFIESYYPGEKPREPKHFYATIGTHTLYEGITEEDLVILRGLYPNKDGLLDGKEYDLFLRKMFMVEMRSYLSQGLKLLRGTIDALHRRFDSGKHR